ncbi:peptide-methionine (S)-S-oxide reductase, partial [Escherichia coli]|nr:peptide-methionine (S)-S-oxide reductase [Escherichia coli]
DGVINTEVGYIGGRNDYPNYRNHPGHAEAVKVEFSPDTLSYRKLLEYFFQIHSFHQMSVRELSAASF